jgi:ABC-type Na+ efflux pump permease subunit
MATFRTTLLAVGLGHLPRLVQIRGWVLAGLALLPVAVLVLATLLMRARGLDAPPATGLYVFHFALAMGVLPILALVAAPAGIAEDLEHRTLPLLLVRPCPVWALPLAKGLPWFAWGSLWLLAAVGALALTGPQADLGAKALALVAAYWAELAFISLLTLLFKRGVVWGALVLLVWDPLVRIMPGNLQRITFIHYIQSMAGSRGADVNLGNLLAQEQIATPFALCLVVLVLFGLLCWAAAGWKLQWTPVGLAGPEGEG